MAVGILSLAANLDRQSFLSRILLGLALVVFATLVVRSAGALNPDRSRGALVLFSWVASCGVLGQGLGVWLPVARYAFAALALGGFIAALVVLAPLIRKERQWRSWPVNGSWLLAVVAVQSLSILAASTAPAVFGVGVALWVLGLATYGFLITLIIRRLVRQEVDAAGLSPDYWITMGALAISTVAAVGLRLGPLALAAWACGAAWITYLCVVELMGVRARGLQFRYDTLRWSTVFPLGMFSVASHELAHLDGVPIFNSIGSLSFWTGLGLAILIAAAASSKLRPGVVSRC
jgi:tellurite resistance protein TehA-like permease